MEPSNNGNGEVYICPHLREAYLRDARQDGREPFSDLSVASGDILNSAMRTGETVSRVANVGLNAAGFTSNGVRASSLASSYQSRIGSVSRGSTFSSLQRTGHKGGFASNGALSVGVAAIAAAVTIGWQWWTSIKEKREQEENLLKGLEAFAGANGGKLLCDECRKREEEEGRE